MVASSYRVHNSYFAAAVRTEPQSDPAEFLADAQHFFGALKRDFFVWVPADDLEIRSAALAIGGVLEPNTTPAMSIRFPVPGGTSRFAVKPAMTSEAYEQFGQAVEAGYETPGLGWLLRDQDFFSAPGSIWVTAYDGDEPLGAACGYMSGTTGGVYFVGTPPQHRGKGVGADVTRAVVDILFEQGATSVTLQSSAMGFRIYETLGFTVCGHYERCVIGPRQD